MFSVTRNANLILLACSPALLVGEREEEKMVNITKHSVLDVSAIAPYDEKYVCTGRAMWIPTQSLLANG